MNLQSNFPPVHSELPSVEVVQHNLSNILPTSTEIGHLWISYQAENMSVCMLKYLVARAKDVDVKPVLQRALDISSEHIKGMEALFNSANYPIPDGFGEKDVDINKPELFSEYFSLAYAKLMSEYILINYGVAFNHSSRLDFRNLFSDCIDNAREITQRASEVLLAKGLFQKAPSINKPSQVEYVHDKSYFNSFFGKRPLNAVEIGYIYKICESLNLTRTLATGIGQVAQSERIKKFISKGLQMNYEQGEKLSSFIQQEGLPVPLSSLHQITDSQESPFSEKLMMTHISAVLSYRITELGLALTKLARTDLHVAFLDFITDFVKLSRDAGEIMIENGWLERIPETIDHKKLMQ